MTERRAIWCVGCGCEVQARLTNGAEIYAHRPDLRDVPRWKCDGCGNHVGCHWRSKSDPTKPLGIIATPELKRARLLLHDLIDPLWKDKVITRPKLYARIGAAFGRPFHNGELRSLEEAREVYRIVQAIKAELLAARQGEPST
jgi:zinc-finger-containing domain